MERVSTLDTLPDVPTHKIFKMLGKKDRSNCRLVSKSMRQQVDQVQVIDQLLISNDSSDRSLMTGLLNLKIRRAEVKNYQRALTFTYPDILKQLTIDCAKLQIDPKGLDKTLKAVTNLELLHLKLSVATFNSRVFESTTYCFDNLQSIRLILDDRHAVPCRRFRTDSIHFIVALLQNSHLTRLTSLAINANHVTCPQTEQKLIKHIFMFLEQQGKINNFEYKVSGGKFANDWEYQNGHARVSSVHLTASVWTEPAVMGQPWVGFLHNQTNLDILSIQNIVVSLQQFRSLIIPAIATTVTSITLGSLCVDTWVAGHDGTDSRQLDMGLFHSFHRLRKLVINSDDSRNWANVINLQSLPGALRELDIGSFWMRASDVFRFSTSRPNLTKLYLDYVWDIQRNSLTNQTILHILRSSSMTDVWFRYVALSMRREDMPSIIEICRIVGQERVNGLRYGGFRFCRDSVTSQWYLF